MSSVEELKLDVAELQNLQAQAERTRVKEVLSLEIRKLQTMITNLMEQAQPDSEAAKPEKPVSVSTMAARRPLNVITNYAWDQSEKFMKIYVTLNGVQDISKENVTCSFTENTFKMSVQDLSGKDHILHVVQLHDSILVEGSYHKVKTDMVLIMMKKENPGKTWPYVIKKKDDKKKKNEKKPAGEAAGDPGAGLMDMLKQMYDDGDDEMKRTISKAWTESRGKSPEVNMDM